MKATELRKLRRNGICIVCREPVPEGSGRVAVLFLRSVCHSGECSRKIEAASTDFSASKRGRKRTVTEIIRILESQ